MFKRKYTINVRVHESIYLWLKELRKWDPVLKTNERGWPYLEVYLNPIDLIMLKAHVRSAGKSIYESLSIE